MAFTFNPTAIAPFSPSPGHLYIENDLSPDGNGGCTGSVKTTYMPLASDWAWRVVLEPAANCSVTPRIGSDVNHPYASVTVPGVNVNIAAMYREGILFEYTHKTEWVDDIGDSCPIATNASASTDDGVGNAHWSTWKAYSGALNQNCTRWDNATWDVGIYELWLTQYNVVYNEGASTCWYNSHGHGVAEHQCAGVPSFAFDTRNIDIEDSGRTVQPSATVDITFHS